MCYEKYGHFLSGMNNGTLKISHDSVCECVMSGYVMFHEAWNLLAADLCVKSL